MNKYAQEKIAQEYYTLGVQLALQNAGIGMSKTASKSKRLAKMLGVGAGGAGLGALGMRLTRPEQQTAAELLTNMSPMEYLKSMGAGFTGRLNKFDEVTEEMVRNLHNMENPDMFDRVAMSTQAVKNMFKDPQNSLDALKLMGKDTMKALGNLSDRHRELKLPPDASEVIKAIPQSQSHHADPLLGML